MDGAPGDGDVQPGGDDPGEPTASAPDPGERPSGPASPGFAIAGSDARIDSALPPRGARVAAFVAIVVGGACAGLIGYAVTDLQCRGSCQVQTGLGTFAGAVLGALGVAVVSVLVLRAMGEWRTIQHTQAGQPPSDSRRNPSA